MVPRRKIIASAFSMLHVGCLQCICFLTVTGKGAPEPLPRLFHRCLPLQAALSLQLSAISHQSSSAFQFACRRLKNLNGKIHLLVTESRQQKPLRKRVFLKKKNQARVTKCWNFSILGQSLPCHAEENWCKAAQGKDG